MRESKNSTNGYPDAGFFIERVFILLQDSLMPSVQTANTSICGNFTPLRRRDLVIFTNLKKTSDRHNLRDSKRAMIADDLPIFYSVEFKSERILPLRFQGLNGLSSLDGRRRTRAAVYGSVRSEPVWRRFVGWSMALCSVLSPSPKAGILDKKTKT